MISRNIQIKPHEIPTGPLHMIERSVEHMFTKQISQN